MFYPTLVYGDLGFQLNFRLSIKTKADKKGHGGCSHFTQDWISWCMSTKDETLAWWKNGYEFEHKVIIHLQEVKTLRSPIWAFFRWMNWDKIKNQFGVLFIDRLAAAVVSSMVVLNHPFFFLFTSNENCSANLGLCLPVAPSLLLLLLSLSLSLSSQQYLVLTLLVLAF